MITDIIGAFERLIPLLVTVLTAVSPVVIAIVSGGRKDREQGAKNSQKLCEAMNAATQSIDRMDERIKVLEGHAREDYRRLLVMEIMEENLPIEERLTAGEKYVREGWNGPIKARYELLREQYKREQEE